MNEKMRILLADDDTEFCARMSAVLDSADDFELVGIAENGEKALSAVNELRPDVLIIELMLPVMDGLEATRRIRAMKRPDARTIPIIAMTANAFAEDRQRAFAAGMDMHIAKPLEGSEMVETLERFVKSSRK